MANLCKLSQLTRSIRNLNAKKGVPQNFGVVVSHLMGPSLHVDQYTA